MNKETASNERGVPRLILFVTGNAPRSQRARAHLDAALASLDVSDVEPLEVDLIKHPDETLNYSVFATPALVRMGASGGVSVLYGDLSDEQKLKDFISSLKD